MNTQAKRLAMVAAAMLALGVALGLLIGCATPRHAAGDGWQDDWWPDSPRDPIGVAK